MENKISVHNLKKNFGKLEVLKDISIEIREGEVVCMIGPSGSGKSTFLRCLNRLEKITSGHVVVDGHPISDPNTNINKVRENIGMVFQHFNLFPHLTVKTRRRHIRDSSPADRSRGWPSRDPLP